MHDGQSRFEATGYNQQSPAEASHRPTSGVTVPPRPPSEGRNGPSPGRNPHRFER
jgi:hypothetical protein